jgi:predicted ester cyclase
MKSPLSRAIVLLLCIGLGLSAGYKLALSQEHSRLERNKALVRRSHEVWSERDNEAAMKIARDVFSNDFVAHDWSGDSTGGLDGYVKGILENRASFPDWTEKVDSLVAEGDFVAARFLSTGTQARDLAAVPRIMPMIPSKHRFLRMPEMEVFRISNGKLAEQWDISDGWDANAQLGLFDPEHWPESVCGSVQKR